MTNERDDDTGGQPARIRSKACAGQAPAGAVSSVFGLASTLAHKPDANHDALTPATAVAAPAPRSPWGAATSNTMSNRILALMSDGVERTTQQMADALLVHPDAVRPVAYLLVKHGQLDNFKVAGEVGKRFRRGAGNCDVSEPAPAPVVTRPAPACAPPQEQQAVASADVLPDDTAFLAALYSDGVLWIQAGGQQISLQPEEAEALRRYLSAITGEVTS